MRVKSDNPQTTWGDIYHAALRRGEDHGAAAYLADRWEARQNSRETLAMHPALITPVE